MPGQVMVTLTGSSIQSVSAISSLAKPCHFAFGSNAQQEGSRLNNETGASSKEYFLPVFGSLTSTGCMISKNQSAGFFSLILRLMLTTAFRNAIASSIDSCTRWVPELPFIMDTATSIDAMIG